MFPLLASKMKIASCVGVAGVSVISVPATLSVTSLKGGKELFKPLDQVIEKIKTEGETRFAGIDQNLQDQYVDFGGKAIGDTKEGLSSIGTQIDSIRELGESSAKLINEHKDTINYYSFQLGDLVKTTLKEIPTIIKDSVLEVISGGVGLNLLSVQKIYAIASNDKFSTFIASLATVTEQYGDIISKISGEDASGVIQIFKELQKEGIGQFLEKASTNSTKLDTDKNKYCSATKLMMHILIGKDEIEKITEQVSNLKQQLETLKDALSTILTEAKVNVEDLKQQLDKLSNSPQIKDPCQKSS